MRITTLRAGAIIVFFLLIFASGFWLSSLGEPLNTAVLTVHKLAAIVAIAFLAVTVFRLKKMGGLNATMTAGAVFTGILFLGTIATGGLASMDLNVPAAVPGLHHVLPYVTTLSTGVTLFIASARQQEQNKQGHQR
jgi:hypothetical protein